MRTYDYTSGDPVDLQVLLEKLREPSSTFNYQQDEYRIIIGHIVSLTEVERLRLIELLKIAIS